MPEPAGYDSPTDNQSLLKLEGISKSFPGVRALHNVHLDVSRGEVHALLGENGAGKSTLVKILSGAYMRDGGEIIWEGRPIHIHTPKEAQDLGISIIYQEFNLVPHLSVADNLYLGREPRGAWPGLIDQKTMVRDASRQLAALGVSIDPQARVADLGWRNNRWSKSRRRCRSMPVSSSWTNPPPR